MIRANLGLIRMQTETTYGDGGVGVWHDILGSGLSFAAQAVENPIQVPSGIYGIDRHTEVFTVGWRELAVDSSRLTHALGYLGVDAYINTGVAGELLNTGVAGELLVLQSPTNSVDDLHSHSVAVDCYLDGRRFRLKGGRISKLLISIRNNKVDLQFEAVGIPRDEDGTAFPTSVSVAEYESDYLKPFTVTVNGSSKVLSYCDIGLFCDLKPLAMNYDNLCNYIVIEDFQLRGSLGFDSWESSRKFDADFILTLWDGVPDNQLQISDVVMSNFRLTNQDGLFFCEYDFVNTNPDVFGLGIV